MSPLFAGLFEQLFESGSVRQAANGSLWIQSWRRTIPGVDPLVQLSPFWYPAGAGVAG